MTYTLSLALALAAAVTVALTLTLLIPAVTRAFYANKMYDLARDLEDNFDRGEIPVTAFSREVLHTIYYLADRPRDASLLVVLQSEVDDRVARMQAEFEDRASAAERHLLRDVSLGMARLTVRQMVLNSVAWLPLLILLGIARLTSLAKHSKWLARLRESAEPSAARIVTVYAAC